MILRAITVAGALAGGAGLSQFPEYSQQYQQRLAGAVEEMRVVVEQFDGSLSAVDMTRAEAFVKTEGSELEMRLIQDGKRNVERFDFLTEAQAKISGASVMTRLFAVPVVADRKVARQAYDDFKPAVPFTVEGVACAGLGFIGGWVLIAIFFGVLSWIWRLIFRREAEAVG